VTDLVSKAKGQDQAAVAARTTDEVDILVTGAGAAGLSAAIALALAGFSVVCTGAVDSKANGRTVALFEGSLRFYRALGLWPHLSDAAAPLETIAMIDATGARVPIPNVEFSAAEIGLPAFGANIENVVLSARLAEIARGIANLSLRTEWLVDMVSDAQAIEAIFQSGNRIRAKLLVAADGRGSTARRKAQIAARSWAYPQTALTVLGAHEKPHRNRSVEFHTRSGPCTFVPLRGRADAPNRSSIVWLMSHAEASRRRELSPQALARELEHQAERIFGSLWLDSECGFFPMMGMRVARLAGPRLALLGEAAHVIPPLAAQGLNLSLRDIAVLVDCVEAAHHRGHDIGDARVLKHYAGSRRPDIDLRTHGIDVLNRSLLSDFLPVDLLRGMGLAAFAAIGPLRRAIMREGVLPPGPLPRLMREPAKRNPARPASRAGSDG
jgi:2-octaprenyl-6-methoxyphenol hydroxylase